jgi:hypothetical protein
VFVVSWVHGEQTFEHHSEPGSVGLMAIAALPDPWLIEVATPTRPELRLVRFDPELWDDTDELLLDQAERSLERRSDPSLVDAPVGTRRSGATPAVRRRRLAIVSLLAALVIGLALPVSDLGGKALGSPAPPLTAQSYYTVQPGDTLWSIATRLDPSGDPRPIVAQLATETGSDTLEVGQRVWLP